MTIMINQYKGKYYDGVFALLKDVYDSNIDKATLESIYITKDRDIYVATDEEEKVLGCFFIEIVEDYVRPSRRIFVTYVAVDRHYRKQGIGRRLFEEIEKICKREGISIIEFTSADFRTEAHAFYNALGYTKKKTTVFIKELNN